MRKRRKTAFCIWLAGAVIFGSGQWTGRTGGMGDSATYEVHAAGNKAVATSTPSSTSKASTDSSDLQSSIDAAQKKQQELQAQKEQIEKGVDKLEGSQNNVKKYIKELDMQLNNLAASIELNKKEMEDIQAELDAVNNELETVQGKRQLQYDNMKKRIQYMYENGNSSYVKFLLDSQSLAELFSRQEYIEKITQYDSKVLLNYQSVLMEVTQAQQDVTQKLDQLKATRQSLTYEKKKVKELIKKKNKQMKVYDGVISNSKDDINEYAEQISGQEDEIEALLQQQRTQIASQESAGKASGVVETTGDYAWPLTKSGRITSTFGYRSAPTAGASTYHKGIDIAINVGSSVVATKAGKVVTATYSSSAGNYVAIYHGGGTYSYYMHCSSLSVSAGDKVKKGQIIALSGSTGISTGPHLHFAIYRGGNYVNPLNYVKQV